ncbi:hypothetical protein SHELI_v1c04470 [Spiroplasma helicoides]|uniref:Lipoprotein n=1 Tax=Spiroplasma helicoides TaxID=216938 RepID=A0A1B3SKD9_9MOLU|nr:hypothetical protein [Spiroplasma helicoides]AOG60398.1 hypothetical protein SHELI_v1c04470 [Spiroplasma helicoides]
MRHFLKLLLSINFLVYPASMVVSCKPTNAPKRTEEPNELPEIDLNYLQWDDFYAGESLQNAGDKIFDRIKNYVYTNNKNIDRTYLFQSKWEDLFSFSYSKDDVVYLSEFGSKKNLHNLIFKANKTIELIPKVYKNFQAIKNQFRFKTKKASISLNKSIILEAGHKIVYYKKMVSDIVDLYRVNILSSVIQYNNDFYFEGYEGLNSENLLIEKNTKSKITANKDSEFISGSVDVNFKSINISLNSENKFTNKIDLNLSQIFYFNKPNNTEEDFKKYEDDLIKTVEKTFIKNVYTVERDVDYKIELIYDPNNSNMKKLNKIKIKALPSSKYMEGEWEISPNRKWGE